MALYTCPVSLATFQYYLNDDSGVAAYQTFLQSLLDAATARTYNYLRRDYSPGATKQEIFRGTGTPTHVLKFPDSGGLTSVSQFSAHGIGTPLVAGDFDILPNFSIYSHKGCFYQQYEYAIVYAIGTPVVPDSVKTAVMEIAYALFEQSRRGLGSQGKATDYSNVLGQSQMRFIDPILSILAQIDSYRWMQNVA